MTGCWLVGACHKALIAVDDRGVRDGAAGADGGVVCRLIVAVAELGEPMVYAVLVPMATVMLPLAPVAVVGMEIVALSEAEKVMLSPFELPWEPLQVYRSATVTVSSLDRDMVKLAAFPSVIDGWSDVMVAVRVSVLAVDLGDQLLAPSELWALTSTSYAVLTVRPVRSAVVLVMVCSVQSFSSATLYARV